MSRAMFGGEFGGGFKLAEEDAGDAEGGVEGLSDHGDGVEEFFHALEGEEVGLELLGGRAGRGQCDPECKRRCSFSPAGPE